MMLNIRICTVHRMHEMKRTGGNDLFRHCHGSPACTGRRGEYQVHH